MLAVIFSILGFFFSKPSAILMTVYSIVAYVGLVCLGKGRSSDFAYALGPTWPTFVAAGALFWVAYSQSHNNLSKKHIGGL